MIYPNNPGLELSSLINILNRDTDDLAEQWGHLDRQNQLERINDLRVIVRTIKQVSDEAAA